MEYTPRMSQNVLVAHAAAVGSMVLLKNVNGTLPLRAQGTEKLPVAVFGMGQLETACCCAEFETYRRVSILDGLCASNQIQPDGLLAHKYRSWRLNHPGEAFPWNGLSLEELAENSAAAIIVITRTEDAYDAVLGSDEREMIHAVAQSFDRVVLVLNTPGYMEVAPVAQDCGAIVYMGVAGQEGGTALTELLTGIAQFRGHLNQTWPRRRADFTVANQESDIYCGYRYFDTFGTEVSWDFGFGLTYGAASLEAVGVAVDEKDLVVTAEVRNSGESWPVSQVVQVYVSSPAAKLPQPRYVFQGYARTSVLDPGQQETVTLHIPLSNLASFSEDASAFVLEAGYYDVRVGFSARSSMIAGSIRLMRDAVVEPVLPLKLARTQNRPQGPAVVFAEEEAEQRAARNHAIRLSNWNIPRCAVRRPRTAQLCRPADHPVRLEDVKAGVASLYELVASMDNHELRKLVTEFGFCPTTVAGALGASADLRDAYGIPPLQIAAGADGLLLKKDLRDPEDDQVIGHQYCTAFPAASVLGCAWDPELLTAVGAAIGKEMREYGVDLWLMPGADVLRSPNQRHASRCWSEEPRMAGLCTMALARGVNQYGGAAVLRSVSMEHDSRATRRAYEEIYNRGFALAARTAKAVLIPSELFEGEPCGEDSLQTQALVNQWKFGGFFLSDDERFTGEPDRLQLEQAALRILRYAVTKV